MEEKENHLVEIVIDKLSIGYIWISAPAIIENYKMIFKNNVYSIASQTTILDILNINLVILKIHFEVSLIRLNRGNSLVSRPIRILING